ncbi:unnamed protein product, partial [Didymodactylos carnosus]
MTSDTTIRQRSHNSDSISLENSTRKTKSPPPPFSSSTPRNMKDNNGQRQLQATAIHRLSHSNDTTTTTEFQQELSQLIEKKNDSVVSENSLTLPSARLKRDNQDDGSKEQNKQQKQQKTQIQSHQFDMQRCSNTDTIQEDENNLLCRLHGYYKTGQAYLSELSGDNDTTPNIDGTNYLLQSLKTANDSGYSSQPTPRCVDPLLSTQPFSIQNCLQKLISNENDRIQFNHAYTVGMVRADHHYQNAQNFQQQHTQYLTSVNIPPDALSSNRIQRSDNPIQIQGPVILRTNVNNISPVSVKLRSLKYPQPEKSTMTDTDSIRREIDRATDEIDYLRTTLHVKEDELHKDSKYLKLADLALTKQDDEIHLLNRTLEQQKVEIERLKDVVQDLLSNGSENEQNVLLNVSEQLQRVQKNIHEQLSPALIRIVDNRIPYVQQQEDLSGHQLNGGQLIPIDITEWLCNIPRHAELEQIIEDLQIKLDDYSEQLNEMKKDNRRLEKKVISQDKIIKRSNKIEALDLANQQYRRSKSAHMSDIETLQVLRDLKNAKHRHTIAIRETKILDQKAESLTRKLVKLTGDIKQMEEYYEKMKSDIQTTGQKQITLDKSVDEKKSLSIVLDEQIRDCYNSFNSFIRTSIQSLTEFSMDTDDNSNNSSSFINNYHSQQYPNIAVMSRDDIQRYINHAITENNKIMLKYQNMLQQQKQKAQQLKSDIKEKEEQLQQLNNNLGNCASMTYIEPSDLVSLDSTVEHLRKHAQELLEDKQILEELGKVKELKLDKLNEYERVYDRKVAQDKQLQQEMENLTTDIQKLKRQQKDALLDYDGLRHNIEADQKVLSDMRLEAQRLKEQIKVFLDDKETLDETCDLLAKKCEALHNECKEKEKEMTDLNRNIEDKLHMAKSLEDDINKFKQDKKTILQ